MGDLVAEGRAREIVHAVQNARKAAGLQVEDRIELALAGDDALDDVVARHRDYIAGETLAVDLYLGDGPGLTYSEQTSVDGLPLTIALQRPSP